MGTFIIRLQHYKITDILDDRYIIESIYTKRSAILFEYENRYHIWTIKDAKNGDVLATSAGAFIYNANNGGGSCPGSYCGINTLGKFQIGTESHWTGKKVYPATKEQRDILFAHMKDAGYEWDSEKKEMKKIVQKSADKTESKFNVGNWYQCIKDFFGKGVTFDKNTAYYCAKEGCLQNQYGCHIAIVKDLYDNFKLWTIQDAKDGDVLYANGAPFIYKRHDKDYVYFYCGVNVGGYFIEANGIDIWDNSNKVYPATQEQRDLLFRKMKEAGYEWDNEKKELKKIIQKSMDKIELKFHEGDWVVNKLGDLWHIDSFDKQNYQVSDRKGNYNWFPISKQDEMRLWTIKDAKDGDVLACPLRKGPEAGEQIFIFKGINSRDYVDNCIEFYCRICEGVFYENKNGYMGTTSSSLYPATKEQRDLLFQEMKQSGYEWDDEKKELVKQPLKITPKFCVGQLITNNNGTWYKILNIKCLDDWYYKLYDVCEDNTHLELCSIIDEKFRLNRFVSEIKKMLKN
ncbi:hypothetical protein J6O48_14060 [bacterium]|nr:hypothetical protein [bacterium]